jgi:hypothetical protein
MNSLSIDKSKTPVSALETKALINKRQLINKETINKFEQIKNLNEDG